MVAEACDHDTTKLSLLNHSRFACQKCPCDWLGRYSQIIQFVIRFEAQLPRTAGPVAQTSIFENCESDQTAVRLAGSNFRLR
jgi:hypothetical protein